MPEPDARSLRALLDRTMVVDRYRIGSRLRRANPKSLTEIERQIRASIQRRDERAARLPEIRYPEELPITSRVEEIRDLLTRHQVVVVAGETGSGKSTQLPKICLDAGLGASGLIGHTQPRRIAARTIAQRIAHEIARPLGREVGYKVRFGDKTSRDTLVKVMTDGVLLAETQSDRFLNNYDALIIDEAHERSLNIDFLLGYIRHVLPKRPDLRVVITSATIDTERFSEHFGGAPVVEVSGRTYPVEVRYRPPDPVMEPELGEQVALAVDELMSATDGDVLVFLPGEREIREAAEELRKHHARGKRAPDVLPLYARLSADEQQRVFEPHKGRRVVLATNVAETSLTVPGITAVVDSGIARISRYSARTRVQGLPVEPISRASADQRKGRCGRIAPGVCIRLYEESDFNQRAEYTEPEILRTNLASVILQMKALKLGNPESFPFVEPPHYRMIRDGYATLFELGAIDERNQLTDLGRSLAKLPIDPRIGRMLLAAEGEGSLREVLIIASALSVQDPRERPPDKQNAADTAHAQFADPDSDFLWYLRLWETYQEQSRHLSHNKLRKWCKDRFIHSLRMREWVDTHRQLNTLLTEMGHHPNTSEPDYAQIHRPLLAGLLGNIGHIDERHEYLGTHSTRFFLFPGSGVFENKPKWVMAGELVRTTRLYARTVARIQPQWVEQLAGHLLKKQSSDAFWNEQAGEVQTFERVSLFGLEIVPKRRAPLARYDKARARELFIHHGLVEQQLNTNAPFFVHNNRLIERVEAMEARQRRRDLLADRTARFDFYARRLPDDVNSAATLDRWRRTAERDDPKVLFMRDEDVLLDEAAPDAPEAYPDAISTTAGTLDLTYRYEPGSPDDGITMRVPLPALRQIDQTRCDWLVPGWRREKVIALIKALPKSARRHLGPAGEMADEFMRAHPEPSGTLADALRAFLRKSRGLDLSRELFDQQSLPTHHKMNFRVVDEQGETVGESRELETLQHELQDKTRAGLESVNDSDFNRDGITAWDFDDLPDSVVATVSGASVRAYPAVIDKGDSVSLRLLETEDEAVRATRLGVRRLLAMRVRDEVRFQIDHAPGVDRLRLHAATMIERKKLDDQIALKVAEIAFLEDVETPRGHRAFVRTFDGGWGEVGGASLEVCGLLERIFSAHHRISLRLEAPVPESAAYVKADIQDQLATLMPPTFIADAPWNRLREYPRYLRAIELRLERLRGTSIDRDRQNTISVRTQWQKYLDAVGGRAGRIDHDALSEFRWLVEELRVSLFAQDLGTPVPVSAKRLEQQWGRVLSP